ncbi:hypothetical protein WMF04_20235 [Sorangium sp. So ce260]|uniref:hypothetical protein n=1 Tax=Sorangium sp. So ce260 TaxID=3133291 RepID=UPI003F5E9DBD
MSSLFKATCCLALSMLGAFIACDGDVETPDDTSSSTTTAGTGGSTTTATTTTGSGGSGGSGGCGGGCIDPGQCHSSSDCAADEYCQQNNCYPIGDCAPVPTDCPPGAASVCGCDGTVYDNACAAAAAGQSAYLSLTECSQPPAGQFPCGTGHCSLTDEYCRQGSDGALTCVALPAACANDPSCSCLSGQTDCSVCAPTTAGGALATECES